MSPQIKTGHDERKDLFSSEQTQGFRATGVLVDTSSDTITINVSDIGDANTKLKHVQEQIAAQIVKDFAIDFKKNLIMQLLDIKAASKTAAAFGTPYSQSGSLSEQIIASIGDIKFYGPEKKMIKIEIDHPLAYALDKGTGIYGPEGTAITPKNRKYMFIPLEGFTNVMKNKRQSERWQTSKSAKAATENTNKRVWTRLKE